MSLQATLITLNDQGNLSYGLKQGHQRQRFKGQNVCRLTLLAGKRVVYLADHCLVFPLSGKMKGIFIGFNLCEQTLFRELHSSTEEAAEATKVW